MNSSDLDRWLTAQQDTLDRLIAEACRDEFARHPEWSSFELSESLNDTWQLSQRGDCCYDRPSIGPTYASWYHGRRTQDMVRLLRTWPTDATDKGLSVIDLGSGTGATLWAIGLLAIASQYQSNETGAIEVHAVDASPFMLGFAERMWNEHFITAYPAVRDLVRVTFQTGTWIRVAVPCRTRPRICAGHLFDHSDAARVPEIAFALRAVAERHEAAHVIVTGVKRKRNLLELACDQFRGKVWRVEATSGGQASVWHGHLEYSQRERTSVYDKRIGGESTRWRSAPVWSAGDETVARELLSLRPRQEHLFAPPEVPAMLLDPEQEAAADPDGRATVILGAAGAGKSLVLAERIVRTIRTCGRDDRILVTAFNKSVVDQLAMWVNERLQGERRLVSQARHCLESVNGGSPSGHWCRTGGIDTSPDLIFMNWDLVMTRLMGLKRVAVVVGGELDAHVESAISETRRHFGLNGTQHREILSPSFLLAERHRVVFGLGALTHAAYKAVERRGRGRPLNPTQREVVAHALGLIDRTMIQRRVEALRRIRQELAGESPNGPPQSISHVFVDEAQDFTHSDFELLHWLNGRRENLVIAGDPTQSLQLGPSYSEPPLPSKRRWARHRLAGSYRIPLRVCECIRPLAEKVIEKHGIGALPESAIAPESRKAAVLGVRPILVVARDTDDAADHLRQIWDTYGGAFALGGVTIAEHDSQLRSALGRRLGDGALVEGESMNRIKGLERPFIVWSTRIAIDADESVEEWVYTILSRATSVLAIVITPDSAPELLEIVRLLRHDRLMPWTEQAKRWLEERPCGDAALRAND